MMELRVNGVTLSISNWAEKTGILAQLIRWRIRAGWTPEQCIGLKERPKLGPVPIMIRANGNLLSIRDWSAITGIGHRTIYQRYVCSRWPAEEALGFKKRITPHRTGPIKRERRLFEFAGLSVVTKTVEVIDSEEIGRQAKAVRKAAGLSRDQAASDLEWNPYTLFRLERGEQEWDQKTLEHFNKVAKGWVANGNNDRTAAVNDRQSGAGTVDVQ